MVQIRIQQLHAVLDELLTLNDCTTWAFITAWNPIHVEAHDINSNKNRNAELLAVLHRSRYIVLPGWGIPDEPVWPPEASFLVLGISKREATAVSNRFGQRAFVFGCISEIAQLIELDGNKYDAFHATSYTIAPLNIQHGKTLENWLHCLGARRVHFSPSPIQCTFIQPYHTGYLCWLPS